MSNKSNVKDAISFYLASMGLPECEIKLHETHSPVSVKFDVSTSSATQMLCHAGHFDLANQYKAKIDTARFFIDTRGGSCFDELNLYSEFGEDDLPPELAATLEALYLKRFQQPLHHAARVLEAAEEACQGPPKTTVRSFETSGGFNLELSVEFDEYLHADAYFESGEPECDWDAMQHALVKPYQVFTTTCVVTDPDGSEIGRSSIGHCTAYTENEAAFLHEIRKEYGRELIHEALTEARSAYPKNHEPKQQLAA